MKKRTGELPGEGENGEGSPNGGCNTMKRECKKRRLIEGKGINETKKRCIRTRNGRASFGEAQPS